MVYITLTTNSVEYLEQKDKIFDNIDMDTIYQWLLKW